jgi:hypothetical protein
MLSVDNNELMPLILGGMLRIIIKEDIEMLKIIILFGIVGVLVFGLIACGGSSTNTTTPATEPVTPDTNTPTIITMNFSIYLSTAFKGI